MPRGGAYVEAFVEAFWVQGRGEGTLWRHFRQVDFWQIVVMDHMSHEPEGQRVGGVGFMCLR